MQAIRHRTRHVYRSVFSGWKLVMLKSLAVTKHSRIVLGRLVYNVYYYLA
jgi:hypothetical protein